MGGSELIQYVQEGPVATLILNRPERLNAFHGDMRELLSDGLARAEATADVRVLVITGAGRAFCAGGDIEFMAGMLAEKRYEELRHLLEAGSRMVSAMRESRLPIIGCINGVAAGAGVNIALACDMRIAASTATFSEAFVKVGLHPDWGGTYFLPRLVGPSRAMKMMMTGETLSAQKALEVGLVDEVVPPEELAGATRKLAEQIAAGPPVAIRSIKQAVYAGHDQDLTTMLEMEAEAQERCFRSEDAREGLAAFRDKRRPAFQGR
ncbi:MAG: enoyl-CoA hydratase/isomerase family protein [Candidatus Xenobia bacterium]